MSDNDQLGRLQQDVQKLQTEQARLQQLLAQTERERDTYLKALEEEWKAVMEDAHPVDFEKFIAELQQGKEA